MTDRSNVRLTKTRHGWARVRTDAPVFKGHELRNNAAVEARYVVALQALVAQMTAQVKREVIRLFKTEPAQAHFAQDADIATEARKLVTSLEARFNALFAKKAPVIADNMVGGAQAASQTALHSSLAKMTGGMSLKTSLMTPKLTTVYKAAVAENVSLIKTIASNYLQSVERSVMRSITTGNGLQDLVPALEDYEGYTHRKAKNVALDQTRKTYNAINRERMTGIGVKRFMWIHSGGGAEPRPLHVSYNGLVFAFDDPPVIDERTGEVGIPGQAINCKCTMAPVFDFSDTSDE